MVDWAKAILDTGSLFNLPGYKQAADVYKNTPGHTGSWGTKDFGLTEKAAKTISGGQTTDLSDAYLGSTRTSDGEVKSVTQDNSNKNNDQPNPPPQDKQSYMNDPDNNKRRDGANVGDVRDGFRWNGKDWEQIAGQQEDAAKAAAEAKRQAALRSYQAKVAAGETAKKQAKDSYDWLIESLGSNKKDLLAQVALNTKQTKEEYEAQQKKTQAGYDKARQEILTTYRDLNKQQEKLMRGAGMSSSSRSLEAQTRLNNLLGKDLSQVSTNEADSIAMIGNAVAHLNEQAKQTENTIETETKNKMDKAALDYKQQMDSISMNQLLAENEREDAYKEAEVQLQTDIANINKWAAETKTQYEFQKLELAAKLDQFVLSMTDDKGVLNSDLGTKLAATNDILEQMGFTPLDVETGAEKTTTGQKQTTKKSYKSKDELDASGLAYSNPMEYQRQLAALQGGQSRAMISTAAAPTNSAYGRVQNDPLLNALFNGGNALA